jgi:hypothetical protein
VFTHWSPVYVGIYVLYLSGVACLGAFVYHEWKGAYRGEVVFWSALAAISLLLSLGGNTFVYRLFYWVMPGFNLFRSQERAIYLTGLALAVLAGYGSCWLLSIKGNDLWERRARRTLLALSLLSTAIVVSTLVMRWSPAPVEAAKWVRGLLRWAGLSWAGWALIRWGAGRERWWTALSVVLVVVDLFSANMGTNLSPGHADERVYDGAWLMDVLQEQERFRIVNDFGLPGNSGCWLRLEDMSGASPLRLQAHKVMVDALPRWRMWQLFDVRYVITWEHDLPGPFPATRVAMQGVEWEKNTAYVHRIETDFSRAWIVHQTQQVSDREALALLADPEFDVSQVVLLSQGDATGMARGQADVRGRPPTVKVITHRPEEIVLEVDLDTAGWLVLGEWSYPGWRAWVDGDLDTVHRVNYALRGVSLPVGAHEVVLRYRPLSLYVGALVSVGTLCVAIVFALLRARMRSGPRDG